MINEPGGNNEDSFKQTNFGFKKVDYADKETLVGKLFSGIAPKYDLMNDIMSFGLHRIWKDELISQVYNLDGAIIDVAGGTGDIASRLQQKAKLQGKCPQIIVADINYEMLAIAKKKLPSNDSTNITYCCANAEVLPFADNSFDHYIIAFGIRNVTNINKALQEAFRVLKPGGKFLCLEFSKLKPDCLKPFYNFYSFNVIPQIGKLVTSDKAAYDYLAESISLFPDQERFMDMINQTGFEKTSCQNLTFGVAAIHTAYKP